MGGFSIVELAVVISIIPIITLVFISMLYSSIWQSRNAAAQAIYDNRAQLAIDWLERDIRYATSFTNSVDNAVYPDSYKYDGANTTAFNYTGTPANANIRTLILTLPATSGNSYLESRTLVYQENPNTCANASYNPPLLYTAVYFVKDRTLFKRTIPALASAVPRCSTPTQLASCPRTSAICASTVPRDEIIATNVIGFSIAYYNVRQTLIANAYTNYAALADATSARVTLTLEEPSGSNKAKSTVDLVVTRAN